MISEIIFVSCGWALICELTVLGVDSICTSQTESQHSALVTVEHCREKHFLSDSTVALSKINGQTI